jgi:hypothetical protein
MGKRKVSIFSVLVLIVGLSGLGVGVYSLYNYQQLVSQVDTPKPLVRAFLNTSYSILDTVWVKIDFGELDYDVSNDFNIITDQFICPTSGYYLISGMVTFENMLDGEIIRVGVFSEGVFKAESIAHASTTDDLSAGFTDIVFLNAGDYVEFGAYHNGAGLRSIYGNSEGSYTYVTIAAVDN